MATSHSWGITYLALTILIASIPVAAEATDTPITRQSIDVPIRNPDSSQSISTTTFPYDLGSGHSTVILGAVSVNGSDKNYGLCAGYGIGNPNHINNCDNALPKSNATTMAAYRTNNGQPTGTPSPGYPLPYDGTRRMYALSSTNMIVENLTKQCPSNFVTTVVSTITNITPLPYYAYGYTTDTGTTAASGFSGLTDGVTLWKNPGGTAGGYADGQATGLCQPSDPCYTFSFPVFTASGATIGAPLDVLRDSPTAGKARLILKPYLVSGVVLNFNLYSSFTQAYVSVEFDWTVKCERPPSEGIVE
jgi:hypothetical protein